MPFFMKVGLLVVLFFFGYSSVSWAQKGGSPYTLIAHRGGVISDDAPENSLAALQEAIDRGYYMVEVDMRLTKDSVLITQHDAHFRKYFGTDLQVADMTWDEIKQLQHPSGYRVLMLEEVLAHCAGKIHVMLDNKISGMDEAVFTRVIDLLSEYGMYGNALMIGSSASTEFFTGKLRLSCTREQLEANQKREDYSPEHYYLFSRDISREDVLWAQENGIMTVAAINSFAFPKENLMELARKQAAEMIANGVRIFQIDGIFEDFFND
nr:hypothetical protein [Cytophagales bacterium]